MKKKTYGIQPKARTKAEIDQDYVNQAANYGHKARLITTKQHEIEQLEAEMHGHQELMLTMGKEIPSDAQPATPTPPPLAAKTPEAQPRV